MSLFKGDASVAQTILEQQRHAPEPEKKSLGKYLSTDKDGNVFEQVGNSVTVKLVSGDKRLNVGTIDKKNLIVYRKLDKHKLEVTQEIGFPYTVIEDKGFKFDFVTVLFSDGRRSTVSRGFISGNGTVRKFNGYELQYFVGLDKLLSRPNA